MGRPGICWHHRRMTDRQYRTAAEVADDLGVSLRTVRRWIAEGRLPAVRVGRSVRVPVGAYGEGPPTPPTPRTPRTQLRASEGAAAYLTAAVTSNWPDTPERLREHRRRAAALMDRLAAEGRPPSGLSDTADAILGAVREEFGGRLVAKPRRRPTR